MKRCYKCGKDHIPLYILEGPMYGPMTEKWEPSKTKEMKFFCSWRCWWAYIDEVIKLRDKGGLC